MKTWVTAAILLAATLACAQQQDQQQPPAQHPSSYKADPAYEKIAAETGGRVYAMDPNHPVDITDIMAAEHSDREQVLVFAHGELEGSRTLEGPVTDSSRQLLVSVTGENTVHVLRPDGSELDPQSDGVRYVALMNGPIFFITNPDAGTWRVMLDGRGAFSAKLSTIAPLNKVGGKTGDQPSSAPVETAVAAPVSLDRFEFQEVGGRPGHEGLFEIQGFPLAGSKYPVAASVDGDFSVVHFEFRSIEGEPLQKFSLKKDRASGDFSGEATVPERAFRIYATGVDMTGHPFQVAASHDVRPQSFIVLAPRYGEWKVGEPVEIAAQIRNFGPADTFNIVVTEARLLLRPPMKLQLYVSSGETKEFRIPLPVPADGTIDSAEVVIVATRASDPQASNHALVRCNFQAPLP